MPNPKLPKKPPSKLKKYQTNLRMSGEERRQLVALCKRTGKNATEVITDLIRREYEATRDESE